MEKDSQTRHLISLRSTNLLKFFAILVVMTAHYYRYADTESPLAVLGHFGFFGAALFAFLSGYGVCISYKRKGIVPGIAGNFLQKLRKCYLPFLLVNTVGVFLVYGFRADAVLPIRLDCCSEQMTVRCGICRTYSAFICFLQLSLRSIIAMLSKRCSSEQSFCCRSLFVWC